MADTFWFVVALVVSYLGVGRLVAAIALIRRPPVVLPGGEVYHLLDLPELTYIALLWPIVVAAFVLEKLLLLLGRILVNDLLEKQERAAREGLTH